MRKPEPYPGYVLRWDEQSEEELHYLHLAEARELFRALRDSGSYRKIELFGVVSVETAGRGDVLEPLDRWERADA